MRWGGRRHLGVSDDVMLTQAPLADDRFLFLGKEDGTIDVVAFLIW